MKTTISFVDFYLEVVSFTTIQTKVDPERLIL